MSGESHQRCKKIRGERKMKTKTATTAMTAIGLLLAGDAYASSAEVMTGTEATTLDAKLSGTIARNMGLFLRNRTTLCYDGSVSVFELADVTYTLGKGIDAVAEVQVALTQDSSSIMPRVGVQYYHASGLVAVYGLITGDSHYAELLAFVEYTPKLSKNVNGYARLETVQDISLHGYIYGTERARLGVDIKGYKVGLALDVTHPGIALNPGLFVMKSL